MKPIKQILKIFIFCIFIVLVSCVVFANEEQPPKKVEIITRSEAKYDTPENAFASLHSASAYGDINWVYEAHTKAAAQELQTLLSKPGISLDAVFSLSDQILEVYIIQKKRYQDAVVLVLKYINQDGSIEVIPSAFVNENGEWKHTNKFAGDTGLDEYFDLVQPEEFLKAHIAFFPSVWSFSWYQWIQKHHQKQSHISPTSKHASVLCILGNLKDQTSHVHPVTQIDPKTLYLNHAVPPRPWGHGKKQQIALIIDKGPHHELNTWKGFNAWRLKHRPFRPFKGPVMLVRFSKLEAMETLDDPQPGKEYMVTISGQLKDGKHFKGQAKIRIAEKKTPKEPKSDWQDDSQFKNHWWNHDQSWR